METGTLEKTTILVHIAFKWKLRKKSTVAVDTPELVWRAKDVR